jgi:hypothetical protein
MLGRVYKQVNAAAGVVEEPGKIVPPVTFELTVLTHE